MRARRIVLGAALFDPGRGGIARVAAMTARVLAEAGTRLDLISYLDRAPLRIAGVRVSACAGSRLAFAARCHLKAVGATHYIYDSAHVARAHPRIGCAAPPFAVWMHGMEVWERLWPENRRALDRARLLLVNSRYTRDRHQALHTCRSEPRVCWLGTPHDDLPAPAACAERPPTTLILARTDAGDAYKGHAELIACWPSVVAAVPQARLVIAGGGSGLDQIRSLAACSPVSHRIEVVGFVPEDRLDALWRSADVFAMPSRGEGFGLVYVEAMRYGVPVIASVHDAGGEINVDGETGFNVNLDRDGELAARLVGLLRDERLRRWMSAQSQARWRAHFRYSAFRDRLLPVVEEFIAADA